MIDAHHHFWRYDPVAFGWLTGDLAGLRRDYLPPDLEAVTGGLGITGVVTVQCERTVEENRFLLDQAAACDLVRGVVGWVPLTAPDIAAQIERWAAHPLFKGVREILQGAPDAEFFTNPDFHRGLRALTASGLPYDLLIFEKQLPAAIDLVAAHPEQRFILDHIAKPEIGGTFSDGWARGIRTLARHPNVVCKFSGVISEVRTSAWTRDQLWPYWETLIEAFGPTRMMFGSDWPVCLERTSYVEWFTVVREFSAPLSDAERGHLFEHTARTAYGLA